MTNCCQSELECFDAAKKLASIGWLEHKWNHFKNWELMQLIPIMSDVPIVDVGCVTSMPLEIANHLGFKSLKMGIDTVDSHGLWSIPDWITFRKSDASCIPSENDSIGILTCCSVYEHFNELTKVAFINEACRVLRVGGRILLTIDYWPDGSNGSVSQNEVMSIFKATHGMIKWEEFDLTVSQKVVCGLYTMASLRGTRI